MKHLILGSSGQIGTYVVNYFKNQGEEVIEFDIENSFNEDLRIKNNDILIKYIKECDMVHFLAFDVGGAKYLEKYQDTYQFIDNNIKIMSNTFELLKKYNKPFLFASSQMSEMSYSTYGILKNLGEKITKDLGGIIVRFWNVYGYETNEEKSHVITDFIKMAKTTGKINMRTNGKESRQLLYADDCAECLLILSKKYNELDRNQNYHITNFEWITIKQIASIIQEISGCDIFPSEKEDQTQKNAMNEADNYILNYWTPKTQIKDGITKLYNLY
jgi:nucleoside-diphosphate-sugar epimerase